MTPENVAEAGDPRHSKSVETRSTSLPPALSERLVEPRVESRWSLGEYYSALLHQLRARFPDLRSGPLAVGLLGAESGCGVSMTAAGLARAAAEAGKREVLLIDANCRKPNVAKRFRLGTSPGLTDILMGKADIASCLHASTVPHLQVMTVGRARRLQIPPDGFAACLSDLRHSFDFIVVDLPLLEEPDACGPIAAMLDGVLLVVESGKLQRDQGKQFRHRLEENGARLLGIVMNNV